VWDISNIPKQDSITPHPKPFLKKCPHHGVLPHSLSTLTSRDKHGIDSGISLNS